MHALEVLAEVAPVATSPRAVELCDWLHRHTLSDGSLPFALPLADAAGCAPFWARADPGTSSLQMTAQVAANAHLLGRHQGDVAVHPWLSAATEYCLDAVRRIDEPHAYELMFALRFLDAVADLRPEARELLERLGRSLPATGSVHVEGGTADETLHPLNFAPFPGRPSRALFSDDVIAPTWSDSRRSSSPTAAGSSTFRRTRPLPHWSGAGTPPCTPCRSSAATPDRARSADTGRPVPRHGTEERRPAHRSGWGTTGLVGRRDQPRAVDCDDDTRPDRIQVARAVLRRHATAPDVHAAVAARFERGGLLPVLDVGCGEGELAAYLPPGGWIGVDASPTMVERAPLGARLTRAEALPFSAGSFGSVALLYVLCHLDSPASALAEARRVLRPGGLVAAAAPSRHDSPELAFALSQRTLTFDAELAPGIVAEHFAEVEVQAWHLPLLTLPDHVAVRDYLVGKGTDPLAAAQAASAVVVPLTVTKRGALVWGRVP
jgi:SAM-dependent methyltransferase